MNMNNPAFVTEVTRRLKSSSPTKAVVADVLFQSAERAVKENDVWTAANAIRSAWTMAREVLVSNEDPSGDESDRYLAFHVVTKIQKLVRETGLPDPTRVFDEHGRRLGHLASVSDDPSMWHGDFRETSGLGAAWFTELLRGKSIPEIMEERRAEKAIQEATMAAAVAKSQKIVDVLRHLKTAEAIQNRATKKFEAAEEGDEPEWTHHEEILEEYKKALTETIQAAKKAMEIKNKDLFEVAKERFTDILRDQRQVNDPTDRYDEDLEWDDFPDMASLQGLGAPALKRILAATKDFGPAQTLQFKELQTVPPPVLHEIKTFMSKPLEFCLIVIKMAIGKIDAGDYPTAAAYSSFASTLAGRHHDKRPREAAKIMWFCEKLTETIIQRALAAKAVAGFGLGIDPEEIEEKFKQAMRSGEGVPIELTAGMMHRHDISKLKKSTPYALETARLLFKASNPLVKKLMTGRATPEDLRVLTNISEDIIDNAKEVLKREPTLAQRSEAQIMQSVAETTQVLIDAFKGFKSKGMNGLGLDPEPSIPEGMSFPPMEPLDFDDEADWGGLPPSHVLYRAAVSRGEDELRDPDPTRSIADKVNELNKVVEMLRRAYHLAAAPIMKSAIKTKFDFFTKARESLLKETESW